MFSVFPDVAVAGLPSIHNFIIGGFDSTGGPVDQHGITIS
jgi:hypothetical protein